MGGLPGVCDPGLGEYDIVYLFIDGIAERIRPGQKREPVLAAWGFTATGAKEDAETVGAFFQEMRPAASVIRCWWSRTVRLGSSRRSRPASRTRSASAAWRTA
ncbi:MAG: hypothetical protein QF450_08405 [Rhodospirillales bacterium]|nr:hypothetical protein [Rhodospirillales bacterium]